MSTTFAQGLALLKNLIDDSGSTTSADLTRYLNIASVRVARKRDWPEVVRRSFVTLGAPYSTGTVQVTKGSTALVGTGTAWDSQSPALDAQYKIALGYRSPFYPVSSITDDTNIVLAHDYIEDSGSAKEYVLYKDVASLPSGCNKIITVRLLDDDMSPELHFTPSPALRGWEYYPRDEGTPHRYTIIERSSGGVMQMRVGPDSPDKAFRLDVLHRIDVTASKLAGDDSPGTNVVLDEDRLELILQYALYWAVKRDKARASQERSVFNSMLEDHWSEVDEIEDSGFVLPVQRASRYMPLGENYRDLEA